MSKAKPAQRPTAAKRAKVGGKKKASHLTYAQAARFLGITWASLQERVKRGSLTSIEEEGTNMIPVVELAREKGADAGRRRGAQKWHQDQQA